MWYGTAPCVVMQQHLCASETGCDAMSIAALSGLKKKILAREKAIVCLHACRGWRVARSWWRRWDALLRSAVPQSPALLRHVVPPCI